MGRDRLEIPEALLTQQPKGRVLIPIANHTSLSARLEPGVCVGVVSRIDVEPIDTPPEEPVVAAEGSSINASTCWFDGEVESNLGSSKEDRVTVQCALVGEQP